MKQTVTSFYDSREYANNAVLLLQQVGIPATDIDLSPETASSDHPRSDTRPSAGFWASIDNMFGNTADHATYTEGVRRGAIMLTAHVDDENVDEAIDILEQHGSVDLNERETAWRNEGWTGGMPETGGGAASESAGPLRSMAPVENNEAVFASETVANREVLATPAMTVARDTDVRSGGNDVLQVVEEQLNVGKRAINRGKVRIHSFVVETPVSETVMLRDETVTIDRRPVDRVVGVAELGVDAFGDRTIEMDEIDEEAVVAKTVRVVEEIGIRKDVADRTQVISDTVRSTKVDIEDGRTAGVKTGLMAGYSYAEDMEVVGSDGQHVGVIEHVDGGVIKLKRMDPAFGGQHHLIPADWVALANGKVILKTSAADAKARWTIAG